MSLLISLLLLLSSSIVFFYLSLRSYSIKSDSSIANLCPANSEGWNCDTALTSSFSEIGGIPISQFGMAATLFCIIILVLLHFNFLEKKQIWSRWVWRVAVTSASGSVVMFLISWFFLKSFCLLCTICYGLSLAVLFPLKQTLISSQLIDWSNMFKRSSLKTAIKVGGIILSIAFLFHAGGMNFYSVKQDKSQAVSNFQDWRRQKVSRINPKVHRISYGSEQSSMVVTEFADFLCPHCKRVYSVMKTFQNAFPSVRVEYINFPLDPRGCRKNDLSTGFISASCYLSKAALCAERQGVSAELKDLVFSQQNFFIQNRNQKQRIQEKVFQNVSSIDLEAFKKCTDSSAIRKMVAKQILEGQRLGIRGTPALFVNDKKVRPVAVHMTLKKIYRYLYH